MRVASELSGEARSQRPKVDEDAVEAVVGEHL